VADGDRGGRGAVMGTAMGGSAVRRRWRRRGHGW
jgi:hypothetical protein